MDNYLSQLLTLLNISGNELARGINVDPSVVSRWKNSQRKISSATYFELISSYFSKNITTTLQKDTIKNIAIELNISSRGSNSNSMRKCIHDILLAAHKNSFVEKSKGMRNSQSSISPTTSILGESTNLLPMLQNMLNTNSLPGSIEVILGHANIINAGMQLLQSRIDKPYHLKEPIYLTFLTESDSFLGHEKFLLQLAQILNGGTNVITLMRVSQHLESNLKIKHAMKKLSATKKHQPYYVSYNRPSIIPIDFVIVPSIGALVCLGVHGNNQFHCAFLLKDEQSITLMKDIIIPTLQHASPLEGKSIED